MESVWVPVPPRIGGRAVPAGTPYKTRNREESGQAEAALASAQEWEWVLAQEWDPVLAQECDPVLDQVSGLEWDQVSGPAWVLDPGWDLVLALAQEWASETVEEWETAEGLGLGLESVLDPGPAGKPHRRRDQWCSSGP